MKACRRWLICVSGVAAGCATSHSSASTSPGPSPWSGAFRQSRVEETGLVGLASTPRAAAYGNITLTPVGSDTCGRVRVDLSVNAPVPPSTQLGWALFPGPCGAPTLMMAGALEFPTIEIANSGAGSIRAVMRFRLDARATYHANVYWSFRISDVSNVMMCAKIVRAR